MEEVAAWLEENKCRAQAWFFVDDLIYLKRGGRISSTTAALGSMLDLKPVLSESLDGRMINVDKVRGTKRALNYLVDRTVENMIDPGESIALVLHADAPEDAERLKALAMEKIPGMRICIENVGPVIGAHCGPGTLAICFMGKKRPQ